MQRALLLGLLALTLPGQQSDRDLNVQPITVQRRMAFVVGNTAYPNAPLKNPGNDAQDLAASLRRLQFNVTVKQNLTARQFEEAFDEFASNVHRGDLALFYFAGHGIQVQNENFLIPVDFHATSESDVKYEAYAASRVRDRLEETGARVRVLILDACRTNPYKFRRDGGDGLAAMTQAAEGTLIAFAAGDNQPAFDNVAQRNGLYTTQLLKALEQPGQDLKDAFAQARAAVWQSSGKKQFPALYEQVIGKLVLKPGLATANYPVTTPAPATAPDTQTELAFWNSVKDSRDAADFQAYKRKYPDGQFVELADLRIARYNVTARPPEPVAQGPRVGDSKRNPKDGLTYLYIPPGTFRMGCSDGDAECLDDEKPSRNVTIAKGFWLGKTPVTQQAYQNVIGKNPSHFHGANLPVETVDWNEARTYCEAIGGRLPTQEEWEYAARGSLGSRYGDIDRIAWYVTNSSSQTHDVATKDPNAWSLFDMLGNVWQWTASNYYDGNAKVLRGGSWNSVSRNVRVSVRNGVGTSGRSSGIGFRCAGD